MKRMHVHVAVTDLQNAIGFYSALFAAKPAVEKPDYAKWMLDDPRVNFAISTRGREPGLDHLGIQVDSQDELHETYGRLRQAGGAIIEQGQTSCCYAKSENPGSTIRPGLHGRRSTPLAKAPTTATALENGSRALRMRRPAARRPQRSPSLLPHAAVRRRESGRARST